MAMATRFKRILCPIDFDENSILALAFAVSLAQERQATLYVLHVVPAPFRPSEVPVEPPVAQWEHEVSARLDAVARMHINETPTSASWLRPVTLLRQSWMRARVKPRFPRHGNAWSETAHRIHLTPFLAAPSTAEFGIS
jgi:nucleotide-binding universal stress UspA family protein